MNTRTPPDGASAPERFVNTSSEILISLTGNIGQRAQAASRELLILDTLEHTTQAQVSATGELLRKTQAKLERNRETTNDNILIHECAHHGALNSVGEARVCGEEVLDRIKNMRDPAEVKRMQYMDEMNKRNQEFEGRLRQDHEEFSRKHAQRLAKVLNTQF